MSTATKLVGYRPSEDSKARKVLLILASLPLALSALEFFPPFSSFARPINRLADLLFWLHIALSCVLTLWMITALIARSFGTLRNVVGILILLVLNLVVLALYVQRFRGARATYLHFEQNPVALGSYAEFDLRSPPFTIVESDLKRILVKDVYLKELGQDRTLIARQDTVRKILECGSPFNEVQSFCAEFEVDGEPILFIYSELFNDEGGWGYHEKQAHLRRLTSLSRYFEEGGVVFVLNTDIAVFSHQYNRIAYQANAGGTLTIPEALGETLSARKLVVFTRRPNIPPDLCELPEL